MAGVAAGSKIEIWGCGCRRNPESLGSGVVAVLGILALGR